MKESCIRIYLFPICDRMLQRNLLFMDVKKGSEEQRIGCCVVMLSDTSPPIYVLLRDAM